MSKPRRLLQMRSELNDELARALEPSAVEPSTRELQDLTSKLASSLGVPLTPPSALQHASVVKAVAGTSAVKTLPVWKLAGVWVLGGIVLGVGLSGAVTSAASVLGKPAPAAVAKRAASRAVPAPSAVEVPTPPLAPQPPLPEELQPASGPQTAASHRTPGVRPSTLVGEPAQPTENELAILRQAQEALRTNPAQALSLSARHELEFPFGLLAQEREVIAIEALIRLDRVADAQARASRFEATYPGSAHARRVQQLLHERAHNYERPLPSTN